MEWNYLVLVMCGVLCLFLVLIEMRRKVRKNLTGRLLASVLTVLALTLIALPPACNKEHLSQSERAVVLLTEGFHKDSLSAFSNPLVIATDRKLLKNSGIEGGTYVPAIDYFLSQHPDVKSVHIIGTGLPDEELVLLRNISVRFHRPEPAFGFQQVVWQSSIKSSDELVVSGKFNNNSNREVKIVFQGLSTSLDSAVISADSMGVFKLTCLPRQLGTAINYLIVTTGNDTLSVEKVPFEVEPIKALRIFILSSAPSFEATFLKRWLAENNFPVAVRNKVSTGKFSTEFLNMDPLGLNLQATTLDRFDVLLADEASINELSQPELSSVLKQVNNGLGLIIIDDEEVKLRGSLGSDFAVLPIADTKTVSVNIPAINFRTMLPGSAANYLSPRPYDQPLAWDSKNRILVSSSDSGSGRIIFSTLNSTYSLNLSGNATDYGSLWGYLIEKAARKQTPKNLIKIVDRFPIVHNKTSVMVESKASKIPELVADESHIALKQNADLPQRWTGAFWPVNPGWNSLRTADGDYTKQFVFDRGDWSSVRNARNSQATMKFGNQSNKNPANDSMDTSDSKEDVPLIFFYLLLLASCSYLWIERKFL